MSLFGPPNIEKMKARRDVDGLIKALQYKIKSTEFKDEWVRRDAAKALGEIGGSSVVLPLIAALKHRDNEVRWEAALGLGKISDARGVEALNAALKDPYLCRAAAIALGEIGGAHAVEPLISVLENKDAEVRKAAVEALGKIGDTRAVEPLIAELNDKDIKVRKAAVEALGKIGDIRAIQPLLGCAHPPLSERMIEERQLCEAAQNILDQLCRNDVKPLVAALKDNNWSVRSMATKMLDKQGCETLSGEDRAWYLAAKQDWAQCAALGRIAIEPLRTALVLRKEEGAATALAEIQDPRSVEILLAGLMEHYDWFYVGDKIVEALDQLGWRPGRDEDGARYWLKKRRWDKYFEIGAPGPELLAKVVEELRNRHESKEDCLNLVALLGKLGNFRVIAPLIVLLSHIEARVRGAAADTLVKIGEPAVDELLSALREGRNVDEIVRVLGRIGDGRAVEPLLNILSSMRYPTDIIIFALVNLYRSGRLNESQKNSILSHAKKLERPHTDVIPEGWEDSMPPMNQHADVPAISFE